mmetsp:Transcript_4537/g.11044  ORF Transcript_4537/g.11044 Transcript_4537/m.11044 type:complete len:231 (+) Transcript_4537:749-1441(+)
MSVLTTDCQVPLLTRLPSKTSLALHPKMPTFCSFIIFSSDCSYPASTPGATTPMGVTTVKQYSDVAAGCFSDFWKTCTPRSEPRTLQVQGSSPKLESFSQSSLQLAHWSSFSKHLKPTRRQQPDALQFSPSQEQAGGAFGPSVSQLHDPPTSSPSILPSWHVWLQAAQYWFFTKHCDPGRLQQCVFEQSSPSIEHSHGGFLTASERTTAASCDERAPVDKGMPEIRPGRM